MRQLLESLEDIKGKTIENVAHDDGYDFQRAAIHFTDDTSILLFTLEGSTCIVEKWNNRDDDIDIYDALELGIISKKEAEEMTLAEEEREERLELEEKRQQYEELKKLFEGGK